MPTNRKLPHYSLSKSILSNANFEVCTIMNYHTFSADTCSMINRLEEFEDDVLKAIGKLNQKSSYQVWWNSVYKNYLIFGCNLKYDFKRLKFDENNAKLIIFIVKSNNFICDVVHSNSTPDKEFS